MRVCGVAAEYNPFHLGHARHLALLRQALGEDALLVCALSGDFVQRGEPALLDKFARAEAAAKCGMDLVLDLPLPWAMASAEVFARGCVALLAAAGAEYLGFGSECGDPDTLKRTAETLSDPALDGLIRAGLGEGLSYAAARQRAAEMLADTPLPALRSPNDILAVEYLRAVRAQGLTGSLTPLCIPRQGGGHDREDGALPSAKALRLRLEAGKDLRGAVPPESLEILDRERAAGRGPLFPKDLETALLSRLRMLSPADFALIPDAAEGLENRLCRIARTAPDLDSLLREAGTKRYPVARLRRMLWAAALGLRRDDAAGTPPYLRVLAASERGRALLGRLGEAAPLPLLSRPGDVKALDGRGRRCFALGENAADLRALGCPAAAQRRGGQDRRGPAMV